VKSLSPRELTVRRKFARYEFRVDAEIIWQSRKQYGRVTDLSRGGMFIEIADPPCLGANFTTFLALNSPLRLTCTVHRVLASRGVGVSFSVQSADKKRFEALLLALGSDDVPIVTGVSGAKRKSAPPAGPPSR
jgi:PilZ domain